MQNTQLALTWAQTHLEKAGYTIHGPALALREMPWSKVYQFSTSQGFIYFKQMAPIFSIETTVLEILTTISSENIPKVIATNSALNCFLMFPAGNVLRNELKNHYQIELVSEVFKAYTKLQKAAIEIVPAFLKAKIQDWRLEQLPHLYLQLMSNEDMLISDGITKAEIESLKKLHHKFTAWCSQLSEYAIPETIEHNDFHDNNILIENQHITINDWGDTTISHPLFSLASWLNSASRHHGIKETDQQYSLIKNAYLENWHQYANKEKLLDAFSVANKLRPIQFALNFTRVKQCKGIENFAQFNGYLAEALREFIIIS